MKNERPVLQKAGMTPLQGIVAFFVFAVPLGAFGYALVAIQRFAIKVLA